MKEKILKSKVLVIDILRFFKLIPNVWYSCEIELASIKAQKYHVYFNGDDNG